MSTPRARPLVLAALLPVVAGPLMAQQTRLAPDPRAEASVRQHVAEDDAVRIEELWVRGQSVSIVVTPKSGARRYEIMPAGAGRDVSRDRGSAGQRVWSLLSF